MNEKKLDKYLTEMKELPPSYKAEERHKETAASVKSDALNDVGNQKVKPRPIKVMKEEVFFTEEKSEKSGSDDYSKTGKKIPVTYKDIILGIVNLISVVFLIIILVNFPKKSQELRDLKIKETRNNTTLGLEISEIESAKPKAGIIGKYFLNESGVIGFVNDIERLKSENGAIVKVTFAGQKALTDKTGNYGIPIVIELTGSWDAIDADLQKIDKLAYLFRPAKVEISYDEEDPLLVVFKYGIFLYVGESLGKN